MIRSRNIKATLAVCAILIMACAVSASAMTKTTHAKKKPAVTKKTSLRNTRSKRVKAALYAREVAHTQLPRFKVEENGDVVPDLHAAAAVIFDPESQQVLWEENSQDQRSIASITK